MEYEVIYRIFSGSPIIKTPRLILRNMAVSDASDMFEYAKRSDVTEFLSWYPHENEEYTREYLKYIQSFYKAGNFYDLAIELRDTGKMIGTCGFTRFDCKNNSAEIGYVLNPSFWHNGYATEAISAILKFGFEFTISEFIALIIGMIVAFAVSLFVIKFLMDYVRKHVLLLLLAERSVM